MKYQHVCLGPYIISSPHFKQRVGDNTFVDNNLCRRVVVTTPKGVVNAPSVDAQLLFELSGESKDMRWYECPGVMGRVYTITPTACEVLITSFDNGLFIDGDLDASAYGAAKFCYGKIYTDSANEHDSGSECYTSIEFDNHIFQINANMSGHSGEYDCQECWDDETLFPETFNEATGVFGRNTETATTVASACCWRLLSDPLTQKCTNHASELEGRSYVAAIGGVFDSFHPNTPCSSSLTNPCPSVNSYADTGKADQILVTTFEDVATGPVLGACESQDDPQVVTRNSGDVLTAYTSRDEDGSTQIKLHQSMSSQTNLVLYHRNLSRGCLLNSHNAEFSSLVFEVYDDFVLDGHPNVAVGFLSGPLTGTIHHVTSLERSFQPNGSPKFIMQIQVSSSDMKFKDSNDICDIEWMLIDEGVSPFSTSQATSYRTNTEETNVTLMALPCSSMGGTTVDLKDFNSFTGNLISMRGNRRLGRIEMQFQVDSPTLAYWYVFESGDGVDQTYFLPKMQKVTTINDTNMSVHDSGDIGCTLLNGKDYVIGCILRYPVVTFKREQASGSYIDSTIPATVRAGVSKKWIIPPCYTLSSKGETFSIASQPRFWMNMCWNDSYAGSDFPGAPDGTFETGEFILGDPNTTQFKQNSNCYYGNSLNPRTTYDIQGSHTGSRWLNKFEQYIHAKAGQKLYFTIWSSELGSQPGSMRTAWVKVVIADSDNPKWYSSGDINFELKQSKDYSIGVAVREPNSGDNTGYQTKFYYSSSNTQYRMFFGVNYYSNEIKQIPPSDIEVPSNTQDSDVLFLQKIVLGSDSGTSMPTPEFCQEEWISNGYPSSYSTASTFKTYGMVTSPVGTGSTSQHIPTSVLVKNLRAWLKIPSGHINPEVYFYVMELTSGYTVFTPIWSSGPVVVSDPLGTGYSGFVNASPDSSLSLTLNYKTKTYIFAVSWQNMAIQIGTKNTTSYRVPCGYHYKLMSNSVGPPYPPSTTVSFVWGGTEIPIIDILYSYAGATTEDLGACCFPNGSCMNLTESECESVNAEWHTGDCVSHACTESPTGACCLAPVRGDVYIAPRCIPDVTEEQCHALGAYGAGLTKATYKGDGSTCTSTTCTSGACCFGPLPAWTCEDRTFASCRNSGGIWRWPGSQCDQLYLSDSECSVYQTGACCVNSGVDPSGCLNTTESECSDFGSNMIQWAGYNTRCSEVNCSNVGIGACCYGNAECEELTESDCILLHGNNHAQWQGEFTKCSEQCPNRGICCLPDNECIFTTPEDCEFQNGTYIRDGGSCAGYSCSEPRGACCFPNGICEDEFTAIDCSNNRGIYLGDNSVCGSVDCDVQTDVGACCLVDGSCFVGTREECEASVTESQYQGDGTFCSGLNAVQCPVIDLTNDETFNIPAHTYGNVSVQSAKPSVAIPKNHLMIDGSQYSYITYQAFEGNKWNIYLRQIRNVAGERTPAPPVYNAPFNILERPTFSLSSLMESDFSQVIYTVVDNAVTAPPDNKLCAIFKVTLPDGRVISNCDDDVSGNWTTSCNYGTDFPKTDVFVEAVYNTNECGAGFDKWIIDATFQGSYPPTPSILGDSGDGCVDIVSFYPSTPDQWCYLQSNCVQTSLFDDALCPSPYLGLTYKPEDLWVLHNGNDIVTRVKYHLGVNILSVSTVSGISGEGISGQVDFMFVIDYSSSMEPRINAVRSAITPFAQNLKTAGIDVRFGLCIFGRADSNEFTSVIPPQPVDAFICPDATAVANQAMFDGLSGFASGGFTKDVPTLSAALNHWFYSQGAQAPGYSALQFASLDPRFSWRDGVARYLMLVTDASDSEDNAVCSIYPNTAEAAINVVANPEANTNASVILAICDGDTTCGSSDGTGYTQVSEQSNWDSSEHFSVMGPYDLAFQSIFSKITSDLLQATVVERDDPGFGPTYIKPAEVIITYTGDLSHLWTQDKNQLAFVDNPPSTTGVSKGLVNMPFELYGRVSGIDSVHLNGHWSRWVYFPEPGNVQLRWPDIGIQKVSRSNPLRLAQNAINSKVVVNNKNEVFVAYETLDYGMHQIFIKGTGDFAQESVVGAKGSRVTRFLDITDFVYEHAITLPGEGVNQLCDLVVDKNDVLHIVWQSNRDGYWEIYYGCGRDLFNPVRVTKSNSRSGHPVIDIDEVGNIYVAYHDNRYGPFEVLLSYKNDDRIIPLLQQDAYLAGYRNGYNHYTNVLPILIENPQELSPIPGKLWGTRSICHTVRYEIILRKTSRTEFFETTTSPYDGHQINSLDDLPGPGSNIFVEIWATTHDNTGMGPISIDLSYDEIYFESPVVLSGTGYTRWNSSTHPAVVFSNIGVISHFGGESNPDAAMITPYWGLVGVAQIKRKSVDIPEDAELVFSIADTYNPSVGDDGYTKNGSGLEISELLISYDSIKLTSNSQKYEYKCLHSSNYIYDIEESSAKIGTDRGDGNYDLLFGGGELPVNYKLAALAGSVNGDFYGITEDGILLIIDSPSGDPYISIGISEIQEIGQVNLPLDEYSIVDAAVDTQGFHLWVMLVGGDEETNNVLLIQVDPTTGSVVRQTTVYTDVDRTNGSLTCTSGGEFHLITYRDGHVVFSTSEYPTLGTATALFDFNDVNNIESDLDAGSSFVFGMTTNYADIIYVIDDQNVLYTVDKSGGNLSKVDTISDPGLLLTAYGMLMISSIDGIGYQFTGRTVNIADEDYFNVLIEFYDNKELEGDPAIIVDSRENLGAFINDRTLVDEYLVDEYDSTARGIRLSAGESGYMFFEASHYIPGYSNRAYPYGFEQNKTYFPKAFSINEAGVVRQVEHAQEVTFSCGNCSAGSNHSFDSAGCSYSFLITNNNFSSKYFNFKVDFYADENKQSIVKRFNMLPGNADLSYCEVDNKPASDKWSSSGLLIQPGEAKFVQIYPSLDTASGFMCGLSYYVTVLSCISDNDICSDEEFGENFSDAEWQTNNFSDVVSSSSYVRDTDILQVGDKLIAAYRSNDGFLKLATFDDGLWTVESIDETIDGGVSLAEVDGQPAVAYSGENYSLKYAVRDSITKEWNISIVDDTPGGWWPTLINNDSSPAIAYWGNLPSTPVMYASNTDGVWEIETVAVTNNDFSVVSEIGHVVIGGNTVLTFAKSDNWYYYVKNGEWTASPIVVNGSTTRFVNIVEFENKPFIVYRSDFYGSLGILRWAVSDDDGLSWMEFGAIDTSENGVGEYTTIRLVNNRPCVVYSSNNYPYDIKIARLLDSDKWDIGIVDQDVAYTSGNPRDGRKGLTQFNQQIAVFAPFNPLRVYLSDPDRVVSGIKPTYFCECSSNIFGKDKSIPLSTLRKWHSSANGYADTRITDTAGDSLRPDIAIRRTGEAIVVFEDHTTGKPIIKAASFKASSEHGFGSGFKNWFDFDTTLNGKSVSVDLDFNEFISAAYEKMVEPATSELPANQVLLTQLDYRIEDTRGPATSSQESVEQCDISELQSNIISSDPFISQSIINKVVVKRDDVQYFTTRFGKATAVVNKCDIRLEVLGTPEVIALRVRNENEQFSGWCPWQPISGYLTEIPHSLTKGSGEKEVCIQAMTYSGITAEFCVNILADYKKIFFAIRLYSDQDYSMELNKHDGYFVASLSDGSGTGGVNKDIYIQIVPSKPLDVGFINFDVIQQGIGDSVDNIATLNSEKQVYEGSFRIYKEDNVVNIDGLARIRAKLPGDCDSSEQIVVTSTFARDKYNSMKDESARNVELATEDVFDPRNIAGRIGPDIVIRPPDDPFLIFGDPDFYLKKDQGVDQSYIQDKDI